MNLEIINKPIINLSSNEKDYFFMLLQKHYKDPESLFQRELIKNNQVLICLIDNKIAGFFMTGWEEDILIDSNYTTLIFLGLSCTDYTFKKANVGKILYSEFVLSSIKYEISKKKNITHWFTTASPLVLLAVRKYWNVQAPSETAVLSEKDRLMLDLIKTRFDLKKYEDKEHPFILRAVAHNTQYKDEYSEYLKEIQKKAKPSLFENFEFSESNGDRFLFYSKNHIEHNLNKIEQEYFILKQIFSTYKTTNQL